MIDLSEITHGLDQQADGTWRARNCSEISYPEEANKRCYQLEDESFWFQHRNACIIEVMKQFTPGGTLFDIGGGNGFVAKSLEREGIETILLEPGQGADFARERGVSQIIQSTLADAEFNPGSIPAAGFFDMIEHIEDDRKFLQEMYGLMQPEGRVYITVPAYQSLWSLDDEVSGHFRRYTARSLGQVLEESGFKVLYTTYLFRFLPLPVFLFRKIPSALGIRGSNRNEKVKDEHKVQSTFLRNTLDGVLGHELRTIRRGARVGFGGSVLAVAERNA